MKHNPHPFIDAKGLLCPQPLMLLKQAFNAIEVGGQVTIEVTDVHAELDFVTWCERFGHSLELTASDESTWVFKLTKG